MNFCNASIPNPCLNAATYQVNNVSELDVSKQKDLLVRIAGQVGTKKRNQIIEKAKSLGLSVLNA